jgi:hypothetical protein
LLRFLTNATIETETFLWYRDTVSKQLKNATIKTTRPKVIYIVEAVVR